jgi:hypothetical protein
VQEQALCIDQKPGHRDWRPELPRGTDRVEHGVGRVLTDEVCMAARSPEPRIASADIGPALADKLVALVSLSCANGVLFESIVRVADP